MDQEDHTEEIEGGPVRRVSRRARRRPHFFVESAISVEGILLTGIVVLVVILVAFLFLLWL